MVVSEFVAVVSVVLLLVEVAVIVVVVVTVVVVVLLVAHYLMFSCSSSYSLYVFEHEVYFVSSPQMDLKYH